MSFGEGGYFEQYKLNLKLKIGIKKLVHFKINVLNVGK